MKYSKLFTSISLATAFVSSVTMAAVPNTFSAGSPAKAAEVNANFSSVDATATAAQTSANEAQTSANAAQTSATAAQTSAASALEKANTVEASVTALSSTVSTNGSDISTINGQITALDTAVTAVEDDISTVSGQVSSLESAVTSLSGSIAPDSMVALDVDCSNDSKALVNAYAANATAVSLTFNLVGDCEGDFQGLEVTELGYVIKDNTPNITLNGGDIGASIIANTETGVVNIVAANSKLIIDNVDITVGTEELNPIWVIDNATAQMTDMNMVGNENSSLTLISVRSSSSIDASNLNLNSAGTAIRVYDGSHGNLTDITTINATTGIKVSASSATLKGTHSLGRLNITTGSGVTLSGSSIVTTDRLSIYNSSVLQNSNAFLTVNGNLSVESGSSLVTRNLSVDTGYFLLGTNSNYYANGSLNIASESSFNIREGSTARIRAGDYTTELYNVNLRDNGAVMFNGAADAIITVHGYVGVDNASLTSEYTSFGGQVNASNNSSVLVEHVEVAGEVYLHSSELAAIGSTFNAHAGVVRSSKIVLSDSHMLSTTYLEQSNLTADTSTFAEEVWAVKASSAVLTDTTLTGTVDVSESKLSAHTVTFSSDISASNGATMFLDNSTVEGNSGIHLSKLSAIDTNFNAEFHVQNSSSAYLENGTAGFMTVRISSLLGNGVTFTDDIHVHSASSMKLENSTITGFTDIDFSKFEAENVTFTELVSGTVATILAKGTTSMTNGSNIDGASQLIDYTDSGL